MSSAIITIPKAQSKHAISSLYEIVEDKGSEPSGPCVDAGQRGGLLSREAMQEALAGSSLIAVLVQLLGDAALQPLEPSLR